GLAYMAAGQLQKALAAFNRVLAVVPDEPLVNFNVGLVYQQQGRYGEAEAAYRKVLEVFPSHVEAHLRLGRLYVETGRTGEAVEAFERVLSLAQGTPQGHEAARSLKPLYRRQAHEAAVALERGELEAGEVVRLAKKLIGKGEAQGAREVLDALLARDAGNAQGHYWLGQIYLQRGEMEQGVREVARSVELAPENLHLRLELGNAYERAGRPGQARGVYEGLLESAGDERVLREARKRLGLVKGELYSRQGNHRAAIAEYEALRQSYPEEGGILGLLTDAYLATGQHQEAAAVLQQRLKLKPGDSVLRFKLAQIYGQLGQDEQMRMELARIIRQEPGSKLAAEALNRLGRKQGMALMRAKRFDQALQQFLRVVEVVPDEPLSNFYLGVIYQQKKEYEAAAKAYEKALAGNPGNLAARLQLGRLYAAMGRHADAIATFEEVIARGKGSKHAQEAAKQLSRLVQATIEQGKALLRKERLDEAEQIFKSLLEREPDNAQAHYWLSQVYKQRKQYAAVVKA
ncbi:MAG: tetratricopeptide repeat protein, partial [Gammaproteobacteria bacterium]